MASSYRIIDEPSPSGLAPYTVKPMWPLFAMMFAGAWLAYPWFLFNAYAMGSVGRGRQLAWVAAGFGGAGLLIVAVWASIGMKLFPAAAFPYLYTGVLVWKLAVAYALYLGQAQSFELHEYAGGATRNGLFVVIAGAYLGKRLITESIEGVGAKPLVNFLKVVLL